MYGGGGALPNSHSLALKSTRSPSHNMAYTSQNYTLLLEKREYSMSDGKNA